MPPPVLAEMATWCAYRAALPGINVSPKLLLDCRDTVLSETCDGISNNCSFESHDLDVPADVKVWMGDNLGRLLFPHSHGTLGLGHTFTDCVQCQSESDGCWSSGNGCGFCVRQVQPSEACSQTLLCPNRYGCQGGVCLETGPMVGEACREGAKGGGSDCRDGAYCKPPMSGGGGGGWTGICTPRPGPGQACDPQILDEGCVAGTLCRMGTCHAIRMVADGEACDEDLVRCGAKSYCDNGTCKPQPPYVPPPKVGCWKQAECGPGFLCQFTKCIPIVAEGQPCKYGEQSCAGNLLCINGVCHARFKEGDACSWGECADALVCNKVCQRAAVEGEACGSERLCAFPFECHDRTCQRPGYCVEP